MTNVQVAAHQSHVSGWWWSPLAGCWAAHHSSLLSPLALHLPLTWMCTAVACWHLNETFPSVVLRISCFANIHRLLSHPCNHVALLPFHYGESEALCIETTPQHSSVNEEETQAFDHRFPTSSLTLKRAGTCSTGLKAGSWHIGTKATLYLISDWTLRLHSIVRSL